MDKLEIVSDPFKNVLVGLKLKKEDHNFLSSFRRFQSEAKFIDLQIVGQDKSHSFNCHRLVLSASSKFLSFILREHSSSSTFDEDVTSVIIPEMSPDMLIKFANHIYGGNCDEEFDHELIAWLQYLGISFNKIVVKKQQEQLSHSILDESLLNSTESDNDSCFLSTTLSSSFHCPFKNCDNFYSSLNEVETHLFEEHKSSRIKQANQLEPNASALPHKCHYCDKSFATQTYLDYHTSTHCQDCGKKFNTSTKLSNHRANYHDVPVESQDSSSIYICTTGGCDKTFKSRRYLLQHTKTHERLGITCEICHKVLAGKRELSAHMRQHTGEKPYRCRDCGKAFRNRSTYNTHCNLHKNHKPNVCPECNHAFIQRGDLRKHMRSKHTNEKPYACTECGKCFARSDYLLKHSRGHRKLLEQQPVIADDDDADVNALLSEAMLDESVALEPLGVAEPIELVLDAANTDR